MADQAQLEIIRPDGEIEFYDLDPARGVTNIGRHPDNDIVIDSSGAALFHAMLDHRQAPFQIVLLSEDAELRVAGRRLSPNVPAQVDNWDAVEVDGYTLIVLLGGSSGRQGPAASPSLAAPPPPGGAVQVAAPLASPAPPSTVPALPQRVAVSSIDLIDQVDDLILVEVSGTEWEVNVDETAVCQVTVINGGDLVAMFEVTVQGLDQEWVVVSPPAVNLREGARATIQVAITPPRSPATTATTYPLAIEVTSFNYPGHVSRTSGRLTVNAYFEFSVGELSPKQQTVHWRKRYGEVDVPLSNKGNSVTTFRLEGVDDERVCHFEFLVPGEEATLVRQAEVRQPPAVSSPIPVHITPPRRVIAMRRRSYAYTITTTMMGGEQMPRTVMGQLKSAPLIGPWMILLFLLCTAALIGYLFSPNLEPHLGANVRTIDEPAGKVLLSYDASRFPNAGSTNLFNRLNGLFLKLVLEQKVEGGEWQVLQSSADPDTSLGDLRGSVPDVPRQNSYYQLKARTWLSSMLPFLEGRSGVVPVFVEPVEPQILKFVSDRNPVLQGQPVVLYWETRYVESLILEHDGIQESIAEDQLERGQFEFTLDKSTTFTLIARNSSWDKDVQSAQQVSVLYPTPVVVQFDVAPQIITAGESVVLNWEVRDADEVSIDPLGSFPIKGSVSDQPPELRRYKLVAQRAVPDGNTVESEPLIKEVFVNTPVPPTPTPAPPEIQLFQATPKEVIRGDNQVVRLSWSVAGQTTNIEITAPNLKLSGLDAKGVVDVTVDETKLFVLTAYNGDLSRSAPVEVTVIEPTPTNTPTATPTATPTPTPTPTPFPPPVIEHFIAKGDVGFEDKVRFKERTESEQGPILVYEVEVGSDIILSWKVTGADNVTLNGEDLALHEDQKPIKNVVAAATHHLVATNNGGLNVVHAFVQIQLYLPPPPPPPHNLSGIESSDGITLTWRYKQASVPAITGFRIYRADVSPQTDFVGVGEVTDLAPAIPPSTYQFLDEISETCGKAYYVVALYMDVIANEERQTDASATSWYSAPCPAAVP